MKDKIKAGDYIRTINGTIAKIEYEEFELTYNLISSEMLYRHWINRDESRLEIISKHSSNIIDLIEEGDYVNGYEIEMFFDCYNEKTQKYEDILGIGIFDDACIDSITEIRPLSTLNIKSIVTKEQFKSIEYKI